MSRNVTGSPQVRRTNKRKKGLPSSDLPLNSANDVQTSGSHGTESAEQYGVHVCSKVVRFYQIRLHRKREYHADQDLEQCGSVELEETKTKVIEVSNEQAAPRGKTHPRFPKQDSVVDQTAEAANDLIYSTPFTQILILEMGDGTKV